MHAITIFKPCFLAFRHQGAAARMEDFAAYFRTPVKGRDIALVTYLNINYFLIITAYVFYFLRV